MHHLRMDIAGRCDSEDEEDDEDIEAEYINADVWALPCGR